MKLHFIPRRLFVTGKYQNDHLEFDEWFRRKVIRTFRILVKEYMSNGRTSLSSAAYLARIDITDLIYLGTMRNTKFELIRPVGK